MNSEQVKIYKALDHRTTAKVVEAYKKIQEEK